MDKEYWLNGFKKLSNKKIINDYDFFEIEEILSDFTLPSEKADRKNIIIEKLGAIVVDKMGGFGYIESRYPKGQIEYGLFILISAKKIEDIFKYLLEDLKMRKEVVDSFKEKIALSKLSEKKLASKSKIL